MKTAKIISIICWLVTALILIGLVIWFLSGNLFGFRTGFKINVPTFRIGSFENLTGPFNAVGTFETHAGDVDSLDIKWTSGAVTVTPYDGSVVRVVEYAQRELSDDEKFICSVSGGKLEVKYCSPGLKINNINKKLEVHVPETLAGKLEALDVNTTSAEITISDFSVDTLNVDAVSGDSDISNINAAASKVTSTSGTIDIESMTASKLVLNTVSGELLLTNVSADTLISETTSGGQVLSGTFKSVEAGSISGEIRITSSIDPETMFIGTTSGGITVSIPGNTDPTVSYSSVSGRFKSDIPLRVGGSGNYKFKTVSGNIYLKAV